MDFAYYLPEATLTNEQLEALYASPEWSSAKIYRKTGIKKRHVATAEMASDLAAKASEKLFAEFDIDRSTIDFLILCTQSPDYPLPSTSCIIQHKLKLPLATGALDISLGCSGYVYSLAVAKGLLSAQIAQRVLLITAETMTKYIHPLDRSTRVVFGDGAAATLLDTSDVDRIGKFVLGTDGAGHANLIIPAGGLAQRHDNNSAVAVTDSAGNVRSAENLYMNGLEIFSFTLSAVPDMVNDALTKNNLLIADVDYFIFHQANRFLLETLRDKLHIPKEKFCIDLEEIGNTASPTIPIAIAREMAAGVLQKGMTVLIAGFGVGYSWGATVIRI